MRLRWLLGSLHAPAGPSSEPSHRTPEVPAPHAFGGGNQPAAGVLRRVNQPEHRTIRIWVGGLCFGQCLCSHTWQVFDGEDCACPKEAQDAEHLAERVALRLRQAEQARRLRYVGTLDANLLARLSSGGVH